MASAADARFGGVDTGAYPSLRVLLVTPKPTARAPRLTENGKRVNGLEAANLGRAKSVVLAVDRSQSMRGQALADASRAARAFVRKKPSSDRIAVVAVGKRAVQLTGFSSSTIDVDAALRGVEVDQRAGHRALRRDRALVGGPRRGDARLARADPAHGRPGGLERGLARELRSPPPARPASPSIRSRSRAPASRPRR